MPAPCLAFPNDENAPVICFKSRYMLGVSRHRTSPVVSAGGGHPPGPALYLGLPTVRSSFTAPQAFDGHSIRDGYKGEKEFVVVQSVVFMAFPLRVLQEHD